MPALLHALILFLPDPTISTKSINFKPRLDHLELEHFFDLFPIDRINGFVVEDSLAIEAEQIPMWRGISIVAIFEFIELEHRNKVVLSEFVEDIVNSGKADVWDLSLYHFKHPSRRWMFIGSSNVVEDRAKLRGDAYTPFPQLLV